VINPLGASIRSRWIIQGIVPHALRSAAESTQLTGANPQKPRRLPSADDRRRPRDVTEADHLPTRTDSRLEGIRANRRSSLSPPRSRNAIRDANGFVTFVSLPITRAEMLRALPRRMRNRGATAARLTAINGGVLLIAGGTEVSATARGLIEADTLVASARACPCGIEGNADRCRRDLAISRPPSMLPDVLRELPLAASPHSVSRARSGRHLLQSTRCWYWRRNYPCRCRRRSLPRREASTAMHQAFATTSVPRRSPLDCCGAPRCAPTQPADDPRELAVHEPLPLADEVRPAQRLRPRAR